MSGVLQAEGFGQSLDLFGPLKVSRTLFITYLDEDIMVARDETGVRFPDVLNESHSWFLPQSMLVSNICGFLGGCGMDLYMWTRVNAMLWHGYVMWTRVNGGLLWHGYVHM